MWGQYHHLGGGPPPGWPEIPPHATRHTSPALSISYHRGPTPTRDMTSPLRNRRQDSNELIIPDNDPYSSSSAYSSRAYGSSDGTRRRQAYSRTRPQPPFELGQPLALPEQYELSFPQAIAPSEFSPTAIPHIDSEFQPRGDKERKRRGVRRSRSESSGALYEATKEATRLTTELTAAKKELETLHERAKAEEARTHAQLELYENSLAEQRKACAELKEKLQQSQARIEELEIKENNWKREVFELSQKVREDDEEVKMFQRMVADAHKSLLQQQKDRFEGEKRLISEWKGKVSSIEEKYSSLVQEYNEGSSQLQEYEDALQAVRQQMQEVSGQRETERHKMDKWREKMKKTEALCQQLQTRNDCLEKEMETQEETLFEARQTIASYAQLSATREKIESPKKELKAELDRVKAKCQQLQQINADFRDTLQYKESQLVHNQQQLEIFSTDVQLLKDENKALQLSQNQTAKIIEQVSHGPDQSREVMDLKKQIRELTSHNFTLQAVIMQQHKVHTEDQAVNTEITSPHTFNALLTQHTAGQRHKDTPRSCTPPPPSSSVHAISSPYHLSRSDSPLSRASTHSILSSNLNTQMTTHSDLTELYRQKVEDLEFRLNEKHVELAVLRDQMYINNTNNTTNHLNSSGRHYSDSPVSISKVIHHSSNQGYMSPPSLNNLNTTHTHTNTHTNNDPTTPHNRIGMETNPVYSNANAQLTLRLDHSDHRLETTCSLQDNIHLLQEGNNSSSMISSSLYGTPSPLLDRSANSDHPSNNDSANVLSYPDLASLLPSADVL